MGQSFTDSFYGTTSWKKVRLQALRRDRYRCVVCGRSVAGKGESRVDHIKTRRERPDLDLALSNLRVLCSLCDAQSHREKGAGSAQRVERFELRGCDADGLPADPNHIWH